MITNPICAWCIHRDGDICIHPDSPMQRRKFFPLAIHDAVMDLMTH